MVIDSEKSQASFIKSELNPELKQLWNLVALFLFSILSRKINFTINIKEVVITQQLNLK
jgi:hypothetical protein